MRNGSWEESKEGCKEKEKSSEWTLSKVREVYEKVARDEVGRLGIVQEIFEKMYGLLEADHGASRWTGRSYPVVHLPPPALQQFPCGGLHLVGIDGTRRQQQQAEEALQLVVAWCVEAYMNGEHPTGFLVVQLGTDEDEAKGFRAHAVPQGLCENLINAPKPLAN